MLIPRRCPTFVLEPRDGARENDSQPAPTPEQQEHAVTQRQALDRRRQRHVRAAIRWTDLPANRRPRAADLGRSEQQRRFLRPDDAGIGDPADPERSDHPHPPAARVGIDGIDLQEAVLELPVVAQVGEERENTLRRPSDGCARADYQPRVSSSSSAGIAAAERPTIASPSP